MRNEQRRIKDMGIRVVLDCERYPSTDPAHALLVGRLKGVVAQMEQEEGVQRSAAMDRRTSTLDKRRLRREMLAGPIAHIVGVADLARKDEPSLATQVQYRPSAGTFGGHLAAARGLLAEAEANQEVLAKYGQSAEVVEVYRDLIGQAEAAIRLGDEGRAAHKGATTHLQELAKEVRQIVRSLDGPNRIRFKNDPKLLGEWISASRVRGTRGGVVGGGGERAGSPAAGGDVRPAA
jgi:hypothetical protein